jgi:predicted phosphodiesterase
MKIQVLSDLHIPHSPFIIPKMESDAIVLAGDIHTGYYDTMLYLLEIRRIHQKPIIFVPGNHEFYGCNYIKEYNKWQNTEERNIHILNVNTHFDFMNHRFIGDTLWSDVSRNPIKEIIIKNTINDFKVIDYFDVETCTHIYKCNKVILLDAIKKSPLPVITITHHAPSYRSIADKYKPSDLSAAFATPLDATIDQFDNLKLWLHGHTHNSSDYHIGKTRILCNPKGYNNENADFNPNLLIDIQEI